MNRVAALAALAALAFACSSPTIPHDPAPTSPTSASAAASASASASAAASASASAPASASASASASAPAPPKISAEEAVTILFPGQTAPSSKCDDSDESARIRCFLGVLYEGNASALKTVLSIYDRSGSVVGVEREHSMEGGFRGVIHIVPELPVGKYQKHLDWLAASTADFDEFFSGLAPHAKSPIGYRHAPISWKFFRSVNRTTPSAYALDWTVAYNVSGSLHGSLDAVRETLFHEIFHLNDAARLPGPVQWSRKALGPIHDAILEKCGTRAACLAPFAPTATMVRGGTYYAFQPNNGDAVNEYAADLATRYYREARAVLRKEKLIKPAFKCGPDENKKAWKLMVDEFFGGVDLVPDC